MAGMLMLWSKRGGVVQETAGLTACYAPAAAVWLKLQKRGNVRERRGALKMIPRQGNTDNMREKNWKQLEKVMNSNKQTYVWKDYFAQ